MHLPNIFREYQTGPPDSRGPKRLLTSPMVKSAPGGARSRFGSAEGGVWGYSKIKIIKSYNYYCFPLIIVVTSNITHLFLGMHI